MFRTALLPILYLTLFCSATGAATAAAPAAPSKKDKCPVCGMFVSGYPNWIATVTLKKGPTVYFDGPKDMFSWYLNPGKYSPATVKGEITGIMVSDYYTLKSVDARTAYFVAGSNVTGPMGRELVPFAKKADADEFKNDHQGKKIYRFSEITPALLATLD